MLLGPRAGFETAGEGGQVTGTFFRLKGYDYVLPGAYLVMICTRQ
jgi:hypothetical protein